MKCVWGRCIISLVRKNWFADTGRLLLSLKLKWFSNTWKMRSSKKEVIAWRCNKRFIQQRLIQNKDSIRKIREWFCKVSYLPIVDLLCNEFLCKLEKVVEIQFVAAIVFLEAWSSIFAANCFGVDLNQWWNILTEIR